jgi:hypothetical protein
MRKAIVRATLLLLAATPAAFSPAFIHHFGVDVHVGDEWDPEVAGVYIKAFNHQLTFTDLLSTHNEHRLLVPRLLYLLLNAFTKWNNIADVVGGWVIFLATSLGILWLIHKTDAEAVPSAGEKFRLPRPGIAGRWFICNLLLFDPAQFENWLSGWGLANALPGGLTVAAIVVAAGAARSWKKLALCILLAAGAAFSNGCGFMAWVLAGIVMAWSQSWQEFRAKLVKLIVWTAGFGLCAGLYFFHYHSPPLWRAYEPSIGKALTFILIYCGNPFTSYVYIWQMDCPVIGVGVLLLLAVCSVYFVICWVQGRMEQCSRAIVWLAIGGFGLGTGILGAATRSGYGVETGTYSRYVSFAIFIPLALVNLVPPMCRDLSQRWSMNWNLCPPFLAGTVMALVLAGIPRVLGMAREDQANSLAGKGALMLLNVAPDNPSLAAIVHNNVAELTEEANAMNRMGYLNPPLIASRDAALIEGNDPNEAKGYMGRFENVASGGTGVLNITGWANHAGRGRCADEVFLTYQDKDNHPIIFVAARMGVERADIAAQLNDSAYQYCGWIATIREDELPPDFGSTVLRAWDLDAETGKAWLLAGGTALRQ